MDKQAEAILAATAPTSLDLLRTTISHLSPFLIVRRERATRDSSARFFGSITIFLS
jgi:hypothetical protein